MNNLIATVATFAFVSAVGYLLVVAPWVIGAVIICGGALVIAWIVTMAVYTETLTLLETRDLAIRRRKARRKNEGM